MKSSIVTPDFYHQNTKKVARGLLGKKLVHILHGQRLSGIITEVEAYLGVQDRACHTYQGKQTDRVRSMYLPGGHAYVYFIYGKYFCFNVVTGRPDQPEAVLVRALEPIEGLEQMKANRQPSKLMPKNISLNQLTTGPGRLCQALGIDRSCDGLSLSGPKIFIEEGHRISPRQIVARPRIGVGYAQEAADWPLRFYIKESPFISKV